MFKSEKKRQAAAGLAWIATGSSVTLYAVDNILVCAAKQDVSIVMVLFTRGADDQQPAAPQRRSAPGAAKTPGKRLGILAVRTIMLNILYIKVVMNLAQIGCEIHNRRVQAGLLQEHVAKFSGLSRVTINQLENGTLKDLGYTKLKAVMDIFGLDMETVEPSGLKSALTIAARSVSTSYRDVLTSDMLSAMLRSAAAPEQFQPHLMALLDETPLPVVVKAVAEAATSDVPAKKIMKNLSHWAKQWKVCRTVW